MKDMAMAMIKKTPISITNISINHSGRVKVGGREGEEENRRGLESIK